MTLDRNEKLYETYYMRVFSYVMTLTGDRLQAEEITQEAFFRAFTKQNSFRGESDEVTWLCAIAKNYYLDEMRRRNRSEPFPEELADQGQDGTGCLGQGLLLQNPSGASCPGRTVS